MPKKIAILGLGWLGLPLAKSLQKQGYELRGSTTSSEKLMELLTSKIKVRIIEFKNKSLKGDLAIFLKDIDHLVVNIPPSKLGKENSDYLFAIESIVEHLSDHTKVIFISSTSVYGDIVGIVDENTQPAPSRNTATAILAAENMLKKELGNRVSFVRFAGLYGPNRHPGTFFSAEQNAGNPNQIVNFIHLSDCIQIITAMIEKDIDGETINGCAPIHPSRKAFYTAACKNLGISPPEFDEDGMANSKQINSQKSISLLGVDYLYPDPSDFSKFEGI